MNRLQRPILCVITDEGPDTVAIAEKALAGGAGMLQLRRKDASGRELCRLADALIPLCRRTGALFIVNDRLDIALATGADGVHLGQEDLPVAEARRILGTDRIIGASTSSTEEALKAEREGADYVGFGHIYPTGSKTKGYPPLGPEAVGEASRAIRIPLIAIGGITTENAPEPMRHGASGIALISAVTGAPDPAEAARRVLEAMRRGILS